MSLRAYQQAAQRAETPRDVEYRLFAQVTRALIDTKAKPRDDIGAWMDALHWNRRMWAALAGRYSVAREDIKDVAKQCLRHRLILAFEAEADGIKADEIIEAIVQRVN